MDAQTETNDTGQPYVLVATQDVAYGATLSDFLTSDGYAVERCHDSKGVLRLVNRKDFDVVVLDMSLSKEDAVELVSFVHRRNPRTQLVLLFDIPNVNEALEGVRRGAFFYLPKTCAPTDVALIVGKALRNQEAQNTIAKYEKDLFEGIVGSAPAMKKVVEMISKVAPTDSTVLLIGESGTGKEIVANTIHRLSPRREKPFIAINCAALPDTLLESEMFGHVKGAFTGAENNKRGLFEEADGGSIFLDEIGDMALLTQAKLLRVLQNGEIRPVGSSTSKRVDVRVVAATNRDLVEAVREKVFREDLYFRLNVVQIRIPPLRERMDALPALVNHFLSQANDKFGKNVREIDEATQMLLRNYPYPGNVRELESIISHAVIMSDDDCLHPQDLPEYVHRGFDDRLALPDQSAENIPTLSDMEARIIRNALERLDGNQTEAARRLGISRSTLWRKMKEYGIRA